MSAIAAPARAALLAGFTVAAIACASPERRGTPPPLPRTETTISRERGVALMREARTRADRRDYRAAREALDSVVGDADRWGWTDVLSDAHFMIGEMLERERAPREAADAYARSYEASRRGGDPPRGMRALTALSNALLDVGAHDRAAEVAGEAYRLAVRERATAVQATSQNNLGEAYRLSGRFAAARDAYGRALPLARQAGDRRAEVAILINLGFTERRVGRLDDARRRFVEAQELARRIDDAQAVAYARWNLQEIDAEVRKQGGRP